MPEKFAQLLAQDFTDLDAATAAWKRLATTLGRTKTGSGGRVTGPLHEAGWTGVSASYGFDALRATESKLGTGQVNARLISTVLDTLHTRMAAAQRTLRNAVADAEAAGHKVAADGWVEPKTAVDPRHRHDPEYAEIQRRANSGLGEFRARIEQAVTEAETASYRAGEILHQIDPFDLGKQYGADNARKDAALVAEFTGLSEKDIPDGKSPRRSARWWAALDEDVRDFYLAAFPERIGALDGLPAGTRDLANRAVLDMRLNDYDLRENGLGHHDRSSYRALLDLKSRMDATDSGAAHKRMYLLGFSTESDGRAIVAIGNPDTARHTAVLVPGTNSQLENFGGQIDRVNKLQNAAGDRSVGKGRDVSVIAWLGYNAPEYNNSIVTQERALAGAPDLRDFTHGLRAGHEGAPTHLTVLAHSYGSTTAGAADAGGRGLDADDMVVVGSPGLTVGRAEQLHIDPRHLWVGAASNDHISNHASGLTLGPDPKDPGFGAQRMYVDTGGHSGYWDDGSLSLENQGRIIAGKDPRDGGLG
ncbi:alpha/beta hydrolase [Streptomyces paludis]|uniref:DUF1023 domain-containing protein n=1 Tax=Streptomyces paludis TaxID=2282738 RepID=A0A345HSK3_9ACTN|nr:alpha/beta hydrolase [Streptomyces paludis]AXG79677.1 hypothetical protein DVK44_20775 [Streptomyces paludis]